jgi:hypothetical protein
MFIITQLTKNISKNIATSPYKICKIKIYPLANGSTLSNGTVNALKIFVVMVLREKLW